ncbi:hypothetical protein PWT90_06333 [Aphanocladium album]|nr:hypothetical protein PWT90_06333 [Aphanocladium album]
MSSPERNPKSRKYPPRLGLKKKLGRDFFFNLPLDLLYCVADFLPLSTLLCLTKTCNGLHQALRKRLRLDTPRASAEERLKCLTISAFYRADKWACQRCRVLHDVDYRDLPHYSYQPQSRLWRCPGSNVLDLYSRPPESDYEVDYHRVQLTLKLSRLKNLSESQEQYLQRLLAPHKITNYHHTLDASYSVTPKVVKGRYMRKCVWLFQPRVLPISYKALGTFSVCCHLQNARRGRALANALFESWKHERTILLDCLYCATEVEVCSQWWRNPYIKLTVYQDLGPEGSACGQNWRALAWDTRTHLARDHWETNRLPNGPKNVRKLWGAKLPVDFATDYMLPFDEHSR